MKNQGKRLRVFIESKDLSFLQVSRRLGHGSKTTLHNWFKREELTLDMFNQLVRIFPDIMADFPEVEWKTINSMVTEEDMTYGPSSDTKCQQRLDRLMSDHLDLLKRYNELSEKYVELAQKVA